MNKDELKRIVEVLIFVSDRPVSLTTLKDVMEEDMAVVKGIIEELRLEYETIDKGFKLIEIADGWQFVTDPKYGPWLKKLYKKDISKLSMPTLETLAIIAYKQPVTKQEIESIRGVSVDGILKNMLEKGVIKICGRKETIGRPFTYGTTSEFLEYFGLGSIDDLPMREEFKKEILLVEAEPQSAGQISESNKEAIPVTEQKSGDAHETEKIAPTN